MLEVGNSVFSTQGLPEGNWMKIEIASTVPTEQWFGYIPSTRSTHKNLQS